MDYITIINRWKLFNSYKWAFPRNVTSITPLIVVLQIQWTEWSDHWLTSQKEIFSFKIFNKDKISKRSKRSQRYISRNYKGKNMVPFLFLVLYMFAFLRYFCEWRSSDLTFYLTQGPPNRCSDCSTCFGNLKCWLSGLFQQYLIWTVRGFRCSDCSRDMN